MTKNKKNEEAIINKIIGAMLMIVVGVMPLVVRFSLRPFPPELVGYLQDERFPLGYYADIFAYWKGWFVLMPALVIAFFCISDWVTNGKLPDFKGFKKPPVIISCVYLAFVIISAVVSRYSFTSWFGTVSRSEGAFMWVAYFILFFATMHFVQGTGQARFILYALIFSSIIMGAIGVSQFMGRDFFNTRFASWLVTVGTPLDGIAPVFDIANSTLFNPNTFGKYTAMVSPVLLLAALTFNQKGEDGEKSHKKYVNILLLVAGVLMLLGVFGSSSLGGLVGIVAAVGVLIVTYLCRPGIPLKRLALAAVPIIIALVAAVLFIPPLNSRVTFLFNRLEREMRAETSGTNRYVFYENTLTVMSGETPLASIEVHGLDQDNWLTVRDGNGNMVPGEHGIVQSATPQPSYTFNVPGYRKITLEKFQDAFLYFHRTPMPFVLTLIDNRIYGISSAENLINLHDDTPAWGFEGRETWGSNRGYIWSRSLPLMPSRTLIGSGPDTFINVFPTHDMAANQQFFLNPYHTVDKAHNLIIQTWITTGGISAVALLALFAHYLFTTFRSLIKSKGEPLACYGLRLGLLCGVSAYVMSSMATDTTIGSTGVFFVLLGVGYGLNNNENQHEKNA
ncbi:MAG: O-antigen ligase family protein [Defluviitaleaceae bacterium]|nr:O-antigen ligase family protein [Defluviitaleaceae bacterium]